MTGLRVRVAGATDYPALVHLVLREQPHLETAEVAPVFLDDRLVPERRVVAAYDDGIPVGCGLLTRAHVQPAGRSGS